jgi:Pentapeptide repeats (8 copies)
VSDTDKHLEPGQTAGARSLGRPGSGLLLSVWLWPVIAIALASAGGTLFGAAGVLLVGGVGLAALLLTGSIVILGDAGRLTICLAAAFTAALGVFVGLAWREHLPQRTDPPVVTTSGATTGNGPLDWERRDVSQRMARQANFRGANLDYSDLDGLQLSHKNLDGIRADGATFRGSQLEDASLRGANLRDACLAGANLTGADLTGANLSGADVAGVTVSAKVRKTALVWPSASSSSTAVACQ